MTFFHKIDSAKQALSFESLTSDQYGRHIYFAGVRGAGGHYAANYIVLFYPDGHFDFTVIADPLRYQSDMIAFKARNDWNMPLQ